MSGTNWMSRGNCVIPSTSDGFTPEQVRRMANEIDQALFPTIPVGRPAKDAEDMWAAGRDICDGCPVRDMCAEAAVEADAWEGMWGGLTPAERAFAELETEDLEADPLGTPSMFSPALDPEAAIALVRQRRNEEGHTAKGGTLTERYRAGCRCLQCVRAYKEARKAWGPRWSTDVTARQERQAIRRELYAQLRAQGLSREEARRAA